MAKLFIGISLALMLATAALGFLAKGNIDKLQSSLKGTKSDLQREQGNVRAAKDEAKKATEERDTATAKAEEAAKQLTAKMEEATSLATQLSEQKMVVEAKTKEVADLTEKISKMSPTINPNMPEDPRIAELNAQLQKSQAELAEAAALRDTVIAKSKENEVKLAELEKKQRDREKQMSVPGVQGRILAVNAGWNFVVLSVGDKQGIVVNSPMLVVRGNEPVARLRVTSVEPSTSIADVIPGSVRRGVSVQAGDTVIVEGRTSTEPKPAAAPDAPALPAR